MSRIKTVGVYLQDDYRPLEVFSSKKKASEYVNTLLTRMNESSVEQVFFYYLTPDQVSALSYAQASDFERLMRFAIEEMNREKNF